MTYLLDVNVLIALIDPIHVHHSAARNWFSAVYVKPWATCPIIENGVARIVSGARYPNRQDVSVILSILRRWRRSPGYEFWPDDISLLDSRRLQARKIIKPDQITDLYLLALAQKHGGQLATFDRHIPADAIAGGAKSLVHVPIAEVH